MKKSLALIWDKRNIVITIVALAMIALHLALRFVLKSENDQAPLWIALAVGGIPILIEFGRHLIRRELSSDLLAGISIVTAALMGEYLAAAIVVTMYGGGHALEEFAVESASSVLRALAKRMPSVAHRRNDSRLADIGLAEVAVGDTLVVFPHEICPADGVVLEGHGTMDEAYLTGEPFQIDKAPGTNVISGAVNGESALTFRVSRLPRDSRYAKIMEVMRVSEANRPRLRRLGDQLGAVYTPLALATAALAWAVSGEPVRFLAVLVVATPCPLIIGIPVAIIGSISLAARRGIVIRNPAILEQIGECRTAIFDKTGTLTYGEPHLSETICASGYSENQILSLAAGLERYSRHPLAQAIRTAAQKGSVALHEAVEVSEAPGQGLKGIVLGKTIQITGRGQLNKIDPAGVALLPPSSEGLECAVVIDGAYAALMRFRDTPRTEGMSFIRHLSPKHGLKRLVIVSGDRESEVKYLARKVGITEVYAEKSPEEKVAIVRDETKKAKTLFVGDGINDAPALLAATVGVAIGQSSDITSQASGAVVMDSSLTKVDELMHISRRMRAIALQSAVGGILLSAVGMAMAASGHLAPVAGAIFQEMIDLLAVLNALRAAFPPKDLSDF